jgi:hypothetical protein
LLLLHRDGTAGVELGGELLDPRRLHDMGSSCEPLADAQIVQIQLLHFTHREAATSLSRYRFKCGGTRCRASSLRWILLIIRAPSSKATIKWPQLSDRPRVAFRRAPVPVR